VHSLLLRMKGDLDSVGALRRPTLKAFEDFLPFDTFPLYAVLHEPCYAGLPHCQNREPGWAALRVGQKIPKFEWLNGTVDPEAIGQGKVYFAGGKHYRNPHRHLCARLMEYQR
jgi:hypothetical protein